MKGEIKRLRHDIIRGTAKRDAAVYEDDEDISPEEFEAFKLLTPEVRRMIIELVQQEASDKILKRTIEK